MSSAPHALIVAFFSSVWVSGITITVFIPKELPTSARPIPVLPAVPSTIVPPGFIKPFSRASSIIYFAALSLTLPPGFINSAFPRILHPVNSEKCFNSIKGVLPIYSIMITNLNLLDPSFYERYLIYLPLWLECLQL